MFFFLKLYHLHDYFSFNICIYHHKLNLFTPTLSFILLHACSFTKSVCKNVLLIHDLASILSFSKVSLCYFINVRLFQLETWMKTNLVSLLNNYGSDDLTTSETSTSWNYLFMLVSIKWKMVILTGKKLKLNKSNNYFPKTSFQRKLYIVPIFCTIVKISSAILLYD